MPTKHDGETFKSGAGNVPERDEETEDFIRKTILVQWGNFSTKYILDAMREVAAFSARRAREKAMESLQEGLSGFVDCPENEGMIRGYKAAISRLRNS